MAAFKSYATMNRLGVPVAIFLINISWHISWHTSYMTVTFFGKWFLKATISLRCSRSRGRHRLQRLCAAKFQAPQSRAPRRCLADRLLDLVSGHVAYGGFTFVSCHDCLKAVRSQLIDLYKEMHTNDKSCDRTDRVPQQMRNRHVKVISVFFMDRDMNA